MELTNYLDDVLSFTLNVFKNLDQTGRIRYISAVMKKHGGYCDVFTGYLQVDANRELKVAIKRLRVHVQGSRDCRKSLAKELRLWSRLNHPNVLRLLGYCRDGNEYPSLISEWTDNGTVMDFVKRNPQSDITLIMLGIAEGLEYLHLQNVVHSDLKSDNVLVDARGVPQICDFGISRFITSSDTFYSGSKSHGLRGSLRWMSVELFNFTDGPQDHTKESDVWAYGMTICELLTQQPPYAAIRNEVQVMFAIVQDFLPERPESFNKWTAERQECWNMSYPCWTKNPKDRIVISAVVLLLKGIIRRRSTSSPSLCSAPVSERDFKLSALQYLAVAGLPRSAVALLLSIISQCRGVTYAYSIKRIPQDLARWRYSAAQLLSIPQVFRILLLVAVGKQIASKIPGLSVARPRGLLVSSHTWNSASSDTSFTPGHHDLPPSATLTILTCLLLILMVYRTDFSRTKRSRTHY